MLCTTASLVGQTKVVPDSLTCISPSQVIRHIEDAYTLSGLYRSVELQGGSIDALNDAISSLKLDIAAKDEELKLSGIQFAYCQLDYQDLSGINKKANRKIKLQKVGLYLLGAVAVLEAGYIGVLKLIR